MTILDRCEIMNLFKGFGAAEYSYNGDVDIAKGMVIEIASNGS